ncbi:MAG TPA: hypothetical protein VN132_16805 [Bdellovibrio sp.]|nr:hypothetical protein [Bdellovibrio sp.]
MKKIIILIALISASASAQIISKSTFKLVNQWFPTPKDSIKFLSAMRPGDAADLNEFIKESHIDINKASSAVVVEGHKIFLSNSSTPIIWNDNGHFSYKGTDFFYDKNLSFKENLTRFDHSWGQYKEFGKWTNRTSALEAIIFPHAFAAEESAWRAFFLRLADFAHLGIRDSLGGAKQDTSMAKITCSNGELIYKQYGKTVELIKTSDPNAFNLVIAQQTEVAQMAIAGDLVKIIRDGSGKPLDTYNYSDEESLPMKAKKEKKRIKGKKTASKNEDDPNTGASEISPAAEDGMTLKQIELTLISVCENHLEQKFSEDNASVAKYLSSNGKTVAKESSAPKTAPATNQSGIR